MRFSLKIVFAFITSVVLSLNSFAQKPTNNHDKLALQYFEQKEFEKAKEYFEGLYDKRSL